MDLVSIIAAMGGMELIKFLFNRKQIQRKETASTVSLEIVNLSTALEAMTKAYENEMKRGKERDVKIDTLYLDNKNKDKEILLLNQQISQKELSVERLSFFKCEIRGCKDRLPPNPML